jgi:hypothetical protein
MTFWYRIFGKKRTAIDILNDGFRETQRIAQGEAPKRKEERRWAVSASCFHIRSH